MSPHTETPYAFPLLWQAPTAPVNVALKNGLDVVERMQKLQTETLATELAHALSNLVSLYAPGSSSYLISRMPTLYQEHIDRMLKATRAASETLSNAQRQMLADLPQLFSLRQNLLGQPDRKEQERLQMAPRGRVQAG